MFKFESKKQLRTERDRALSQLKEALYERDKTQKENATLKEDCDLAKLEKELVDKAKIAVEEKSKEDKTTIDELNRKIKNKDKNLEKLRKNNQTQSARNTNLIRHIKKLDSDLAGARELITKLNEENTRLKNRPTLEQLKNEKVIRREKRRK